MPTHEFLGTNRASRALLGLTPGSRLKFVSGQALEAITGDSFGWALRGSGRALLRATCICGNVAMGVETGVAMHHREPLDLRART